MYKPLIRQKLWFFALDFLLILVSFCLAFYVRLGSFARPDFPFGHYMENAILVTPIWLLLLIWGGKYELREHKLGQMLRIVSLSALTSATVFVLVFFFRREIFFSRAIVLYIFLFGTLLTMASFALERKWQQWKSRHQRDIVRVLIIGANRPAREMIESLQHRQSRHVPVAVLAPFGSHDKSLSGVPVMGKLDALERVTDQESIDEIVLCDGAEQMLNLLSFAEGRFLQFRISPELLGVFRDHIAPARLGGKTVLSLRPSPLFGWGQFWKRGFDMFFGLLLTVILCPIFVFQKYILGRFTTEKRIGAGGKEFMLFCLRSQKSDSTSLFRHLPNVLNVLRGEMSFVGPRPALPEEWAQLPAHYKRRMVLRPGMLGPWQLKKITGAEDDFQSMCQDDMGYILNWSFWGDMRIIMSAKWEMLKRLV